MKSKLGPYFVFALKIKTIYMTVSIGCEVDLASQSFRKMVTHRKVKSALHLRLNKVQACFSSRLS